MQLICPECYSNDIDVDHTTKDIYCHACGLVLQGLQHQVNGKTINYPFDEAQQLGHQFMKQIKHKYDLLHDITYIIYNDNPLRSIKQD
jgi:transcription initiation factor TFIIIB Brf1 subunit/transcription initiation factor TFIIB